MIYSPGPLNIPHPQKEWIFERLDPSNGEVVKKVGVKYNLTMIRPPSTPDRTAMDAKMALGKATPEEASDYIEYWNERVEFIFKNADTLPGFFTVTKY